MDLKNYLTGYEAFDYHLKFRNLNLATHSFPKSKELEFALFQFHLVE